VWDTAQDKVIFKTVAQDFERPVRPEAVANQNPWFLKRLCFSLGIKYMYELVEANLRVGVSRFGARVMLSRGGLYGPVALMG
jgi:hypothetical protein